MKCLINGKIILKNQILENKVLVFDEKIIDIADSVPKDCEVIDADGKYLLLLPYVGSFLPHESPPVLRPAREHDWQVF